MNTKAKCSRPRLSLSSSKLLSGLSGCRMLNPKAQKRISKTLESFHLPESRRSRRLSSSSAIVSHLARLQATEKDKTVGAQPY